MNSIFKTLLNPLIQLFAFFGHEFSFTNKAEGFPGYVKKAKKSGVDVNDWEEEQLGWIPALPILKQVVSPFVKPDSVICELGPGTGRWSRHIIKLIPKGRLFIVDHSKWIIRFLKQYFSSYSNVEPRKCDSCSLPLKDSEIDLFFSAGTFIAFKLGFFLAYAGEISRVLKPGGLCIIDFLDINSQEGWNHFLKHSCENGFCYSYHSENVIERLFLQFGLKIERRFQLNKSKFLILRKEIEKTEQ